MSSTLLAAILFTGAWAAFAVIGFRIALLYRPQDRIEEHNDTYGVYFGMVGLLYAILLAFVVGMPRVQTLPILLWSYLGGRSSIWTYGAVVSLVMLAPTVILLFVAERVLKQEYLAAGFGKA